MVVVYVCFAVHTSDTVTAGTEAGTLAERLASRAILGVRHSCIEIILVKIRTAKWWGVERDGQQ